MANQQAAASPPDSEPTNFRDLLPVPRAVVDLLIKLKEYPMLKEFISAESQEVQQAFELFTKSVYKSGDHASIWYPQLPSEETLTVELLQLEVVNETDDAKEENTKNDCKLTISDISDLHIAVRQGMEKGVDVNGNEGENYYSPLHAAILSSPINIVKSILKNIHIGMPVYCSTEEDATALRTQNLIDVRICDTNGCKYIGCTESAVVSTLIAECPLSNKKRTDLVLKKFQTDFLDFTKPHCIKYSAREVELNSRLRHDNIGFALGIYVQLTDDAYLITGLVFEHHGIELRYYISEKRGNGFINTSTIVKIVTQIASALQFLHRQVPPVIHRDVKPNNILVSERDGHPHVKLIDYGHSRTEADLMTANFTERTYAAPEIFATEREETNYTTTIDIYSFGMVMYFVTVGKNPFERRNEEGTVIPFKDFGNYINSPNKDGNYPRPEFHAAYEYPEFEKLIKDCWKHTPEERLRWDQINDILTAMPE